VGAPGFAERINELPEPESDEMLDYLFAHQLQPQFHYTNVWAENDLLIWDHLGTLHRAIADYGPDEIRLIRRCQVMATKVLSSRRCAPRSGRMSRVRWRFFLAACRHGGVGRAPS
jgi:alpha-ketoglutarate-dependent taurine dioxygenase